ncbi:alkane 1-monooxygenase [Gordonia aichiensis]|uniref:Alkane-1-monooxygenase n=1 Tax=Gordonia aichiensis NBRC 108223 TaxID=1220583 RepID=L7KEJ7_9ACTN|nr:alkane 1-monooxygenase [Gordonia aichiensis]GAC47019.1 alkane-1-monooxygenase [Gordonia aichiensis NBRC 108223]
MMTAAYNWTDRRRYLWLCGLIVPLSPFLGYAMVDRLGPGMFWAFGSMVMAVVLPVIDVLRGSDSTSPPAEVYRKLDADRYYRWCVYLYLPLQYTGLVFACWCWTYAPMGTAERLALASTVAVVGGVGINAAHELGHRRTDRERFLSKIALAQSAYGHFYVEHNHGHHIRVATHDDPASARFGESYWRFVPRSIVGGFLSGWRYETGRLHRSGHRTLGWRNNILNAWAITVVLWAGLTTAFGLHVLPWLVLQAIGGVMILECANYIEHYGLLREKSPGGNYRRVTPRDSWNSDHVWSNLFLYHLQRHSDHHANPARRYQTLRSAPDAPQLPAGYATMCLLATIPPLWRRVMDKRVLAFQDDDFDRINLAPRDIRLRRAVSSDLS